MQILYVKREGAGSRIRTLACILWVGGSSWFFYPNSIVVVVVA